MIKNYLIGLIFFLNAVMGLQRACAASGGLSDTEIQIGIVNQQSGPIAASGLALTAGLRAAFERANASGGVHGRKILMQVQDDRYDPSRAFELTKKLVADDQIFALTGFNATASIKATFPIICKSQIPFLFPRSGDLFIRDSHRRNIFNFHGTFDEETDLLFKRMTAAGLKRFAIVYQPDALGDALRSGAVSAIKKYLSKDYLQTGRPFVAVSEIQREGAGEKDFAEAFAKLKAGKPDAILVAGSSATTAALIRLAAKEKVAWTWMISNNTNAVVGMITGLSPNLVVAQVVPSFAKRAGFAAEFRDDMKKAGAEKWIDYIGYEGYIDGRIIVEALNRAGRNLTREKMIESLEGKSFDFGDVHVHWSRENHNSSGSVYLTRLQKGELVAF